MNTVTKKQNTKLKPKAEQDYDFIDEFYKSIEENLNALDSQEVLEELINLYDQTEDEVVSAFRNTRHEQKIKTAMEKAIEKQVTFNVEILKQNDERL